MILFVVSLERMPFSETITKTEELFSSVCVSEGFNKRETPVGSRINVFSTNFG